jgi:uncharacterized protein
MSLLQELVEGLPDGKVVEVRIGLNWTAVVVEAGRDRRCGLASTLSAGHSHGEERQVAVPQAGQLQNLSGRELAQLVLSDRPTLASVGMAAINALLPRYTERWVDANAEQMVAEQGQGKRVVMVGHFPFAGRLRAQVGELLILEQEPGEDDLPATEAPEVIPGAQVVMITGMTLTNHTLEGLLKLCSPQALVVLTGPSTPLSPLLFNYGVTVLSGAVVVDIDSVLRCASQGGNFRQLHQSGVRLVNLLKEGQNLTSSGW